MDYVLVAQGGITYPAINHSINDADRHMEEAKAVVAALAKAGYHTFTLYKTTESPNHHVRVASFSAHIPAPEVTVK